MIQTKQIMQFGKVPNPENCSFHLPNDHPITQTVFDEKHKLNTQFTIGCAKWNKQDLKDFYPKGIKDELRYYASQFNSIELNATFYKLYEAEQYQKWYHKTPKDFKFYPKINQDISHYYQLHHNCYPLNQKFIESIQPLQNKLGMVFLQMHHDFSPTQIHNLKDYIKKWPSNIPLAIELRHSNWFHQAHTANKLYSTYQQYNITNIITDTAGRRDLLHMALTTPTPFIRFVGANHASDYDRLDQWIEKINIWYQKGIKSLSFFIHQNTEIESVKLASYFIENLNKKLKLNLKKPKTLTDIRNQQQELF